MNLTIDPNDYYTTEEVSKLLKTTPANVSFLCRTGKLKAVKPFGVWIIPKAAIASILGMAAQTTTETNTEENGVELINDQTAQNTNVELDLDV